MPVRWFELDDWCISKAGCPVWKPSFVLISFRISHMIWRKFWNTRPDFATILNVTFQRSLNEGSFEMRRTISLNFLKNLAKSGHVIQTLFYIRIARTVPWNSINYLWFTVFFNPVYDRAGHFCKVPGSQARFECLKKWVHQHTELENKPRELNTNLMKISKELVCSAENSLLHENLSWKPPNQT